MPSFDAVVEPNRVELRNAVDQCQREIGTRFDFKGSDARVEAGDDGLTLHADSEFQLGQVRDILLAKLSKRGVDARFLQLDGVPERVGGDKMRLLVPVKAGIGSDDARRLQGLKDDLQSAIALLRREVTDLPLTFKNFRD
jgi:cyclic-di-GMP-binding protein